MKHKENCDQVATLSTWAFFHCYGFEHIGIYLFILQNTIRNKSDTKGVNWNSVSLFTMNYRTKQWNELGNEIKIATDTPLLAQCKSRISTNTMQGHWLDMPGSSGQLLMMKTPWAIQLHSSLHPSLSHLGKIWNPRIFQYAWHMQYLPNPSSVFNKVKLNPESRQ